MGVECTWKEAMEEGIWTLGRYEKTSVIEWYRNIESDKQRWIYIDAGKLWYDHAEIDR